MNVLVIHYRKMLVGGIENYIEKMVKSNINVGNKVVWIAEKPLIVAPIYKNIFNADCLKIVYSNIHGFRWGRIPELPISKDDKVIIVSFGFLDHARALEYRKCHPDFMINALYFIPHFTGPLVFPEQYFGENKVVRNKIARIYQKWIKSGFIFCFGDKHYDALSTTYGINIGNRRQMVYRFDTRDEFSEVEILNRFNRDEFRIVGSGRFDFPHKGFFIGLIRTFGMFKARYPNLSLYLIGEPIGNVDSMSMMREEIIQLPIDFRSDIHFKTNMPENELAKFYRTCNLSVAVAGCASLAGKNGVLSLPARHYDYSCEVYGFIPESKNRTLDSTPGTPLSVYLEKALKMTESEYIDNCRRSYYAYDIPQPNGNHYFENITTNLDYKISTIDLVYLKFLFFLHKIKFKLSSFHL